MKEEFLKFVKDMNDNGNLLKDQDDECIFSFKHSKKNAALSFRLDGNWELFSLVFSMVEYVNIEGHEKEYKEVQNMILNTALNICKEDKGKRDKLIDGLNPKVTRTDEILDQIIPIAETITPSDGVPSTTLTTPPYEYGVGGVPQGVYNESQYS